MMVPYLAAYTGSSPWRSCVYRASTATLNAPAPKRGTGNLEGYWKSEQEV